VGHKVFQEFAHAMCQMFTGSPQNGDLIDLLILGPGTLRMDFLTRRSTHEGIAVQNIPFVDRWADWSAGRLGDLEIPADELREAVLVVEYRVEPYYQELGMGWLCARYNLDCSGLVAAPDRRYEMDVHHEQEWGLSQIGYQQEAETSRTTMSSSAPEVREALAQSVAVTDDALAVDLVDGRTVSVPLAWYPHLVHGSAEERSNWRVLGRGAGIHWPDLDEDISVAGLLAGLNSGETQDSLRRWLEGRQLEG